MYIYIITRNKNGKYYIGKRQKDPENDKTYYGSGIIIKNIIKKDGVNNLTKEILMDNIKTHYELCYFEKMWISLLHSTDPEYGYNLCEGGIGCSGFKQSEETIKKRIEKTKGMKRSEYSKINIANGHKGIKLSNNHIKKISEGNKKRYEDINERIKTSIAVKKRWKNKPYKRYKQITEIERINKSNAQKGENNSMYGRKIFDIWVEKYGYEEALKKEQLRRLKISESHNKGKK